MLKWLSLKNFTFYGLMEELYFSIIRFRNLRHNYLSFCLSGCVSQSIYLSILLPSFINSPIYPPHRSSLLASLNPDLPPLVCPSLHTSTCPSIQRISPFLCPSVNPSILFSFFIQAISIAPVQVHFYSEALPTQHGYCIGVSC